MVTMEAKFASEDSFVDKLSEKICLNRFWEGEQGYYTVGTLGPSLPHGAKNKPALDRVSILLRFGNTTI